MTLYVLYCAYLLAQMVEGFSDEWSGLNKWNHELVSKYGPDHWNKTWPECGGKKQSPVDIITDRVWYSSSLTVFDMIGYESIPPGAHWELVNAGHAVQIVLTGNYKIHDGGLPGVYKAVHIEFHWGPNHKTGTEHMINGNAYAMEMEIVHYNTKYKSQDEAIVHEDGLAVLSFLIKVGAHGNPAFTQIINNLPNITHQGSSISLRPVPIFSLLPGNMNNYYRYTGSLTIPPCVETVTWSVFTGVAEISEKQLEAFHNFKTLPPVRDQPSGHDLQDVDKSVLKTIITNCRPIQPVGDRTVYSSDPEDANILNSPLASTVSIVLAFCLGFLIMIFVINRPSRCKNNEEGLLDPHED